MSNFLRKSMKYDNVTVSPTIHYGHTFMQSSVMGHDS